MKFQFKIQPFQTEAVESVVKVFSGQPRQEPNTYIIDKGKRYGPNNDGQLQLFDDDPLAGYRNADIRLTSQQLLENLHRVQDAQGIERSTALAPSDGRCALDVEMETGTGKTYVYTKTMFELERHYGWTKYVVVVPSLAIREGVKKSFAITTEHFMQTYGKKARVFVYNSDNLQEIEQFSSSSQLQVMIINMQAFNTSFNEEKNVAGRAGDKGARIIFTRRDRFGSRRPIDVISANQPILILDEPQKMSGTATRRAIKKFNPLFTLNYSATHRETHNPVYRLDALDAYNQRLVKKIEVVGFELKNLHGTAHYLFLEGIELSKDHAPRARINFERRQQAGIKRVTQTFEVGDNLEWESGLKEYAGYVVTDILPREGKVLFVNGEEITAGVAYGNVEREHKARIQIRQTIEAHLRKECELFKRGIKTLSLFFIDEVTHYRVYDEQGNQGTGPLGTIFEEEYGQMVSERLNLFEPAYSAYLQGIDTKRTHAGYFSIDKKGHAINSKDKKGEGSDDISAYDLIMKDKERLLSFDEPVRFIFSHSALREGWDNPNVFQICAMRQSNSSVQKRQEVGRGLRLCVDRTGRRMDSEVLGPLVQDINRLTVVASEGYASYVDGLQKEISADLYDRPTRANYNFFHNRQVRLADGSTHTIDDSEAALIFSELLTRGYLTREGVPTEKFRQDAQQDQLQPLCGPGLEPLSAGVYQAVQSIYDPQVLDGMVEQAPTTDIKENRLNDNFQREEFKTLWNSINHHYAYRVAFDSQELVDKAVAAINAHLSVSELYYVVEMGVQTDRATVEQMEQGKAFVAHETSRERLSVADVSTVRYDLLGVVGEKTKLTRKTVATILSRISPSKFYMYRANPEEFLAKVCRLILEQKATMIVEHIAYNRVEGTFDNNIFTEHHTDFKRAFPGKKSITPYVFTDGMAEESTERKFLRELEKANEVVVYAKLPRGFYIPTPVGRYSPDWAIAFREGAVKHVYFVAETKGSMQGMDLRGVEQSKIDCAKKLFRDLLSEEHVTYDVVDNYENLMDIVMDR